MSFFRSPVKMWNSQGEKSGLYRGCWSVSQPNLWSLYPTGLAVRGQALSCKQMIPSDSIPGHGHIAATKKRTTSLCCSSLLASISNIGQIYFTLSSPPEQWRNNFVDLWFSLCMSPTLQMAVSIRSNSVASFCEECVLWRVFGFHLTAPHTRMQVIEN